MQIDPDILGERIVILGPSNSGKSTLAEKLGARLDMPVCHLDQIAHRPHTKWERLPHEDFRAQHDAFIEGERWVMDGNYSTCMRQRLARASAVIWLDPPLWRCIARYVRRCWRARWRQSGEIRAGGLEGAESEFSWGLIWYTLRHYPQNKKKYRAILAQFPDLSVIISRDFIDLE